MNAIEAIRSRTADLNSSVQVGVTRNQGTDGLSRRMFSWHSLEAVYLWVGSPRQPHRRISACIYM